MAKALRLYLTAKERIKLRGVLFDEAEVLRERMMEDEECEDYKEQYDLVCNIWEKLHK
mgnify:CR=1 FL=1|tara:strand:- start:50 stop:223 length:174 start_codon:yes stop_codon:yes gene_type:complete